MRCFVLWCAAMCAYPGVRRVVWLLQGSASLNNALFNHMKLALHGTAPEVPAPHFKLPQLKLSPEALATLPPVDAAVVYAPTVEALAAEDESVVRNECSRMCKLAASADDAPLAASFPPVTHKLIDVLFERNDSWTLAYAAFALGKLLSYAGAVDSLVQYCSSARPIVARLVALCERQPVVCNAKSKDAPGGAPSKADVLIQRLLARHCAVILSTLVQKQQWSALDLGKAQLGEAFERIEAKYSSSDAIVKDAMMQALAGLCGEVVATEDVVVSGPPPAPWSLLVGAIKSQGKAVSHLMNITESVLRAASASYTINDDAYTVCACRDHFGSSV